MSEAVFSQGPMTLSNASNYLHCKRSSNGRQARVRFGVRLAPALLVLLVGLGSAMAQDQVFSVTNANSIGSGSLWQAVMDANAASPTGSHTIQFASGLGPITPPRSLFANANITFVGNNSTISGDNVDRIFFVAGGTVEFQDLNLINGRAKGGAGGGGGNDFGNSGGGGGGADSGDFRHARRRRRSDVFHRMTEDRQVPVEIPNRSFPLLNRQFVGNGRAVGGENRELNLRHPAVSPQCL